MSYLLMGKQKAISRLERLERLSGLLKGEESTTVQELARQLETSSRTIHRDLSLLQARGYPIETDRGRGGGVRLDRHWHLGRINLGEEEAIDLLLSMTIAEKSNLPMLLSRLRSVRQKLAAAFSHAQQAKIRALRGRILIGGPASPDVIATYAEPNRRDLAVVKIAFFEMRILRLSYSDAAGQVTTREIEPQFLYLNLPVWYLLAWDHLRSDVRLFRLDRLRNVSKLEKQFRLRDPKPFLTSAEREIQSL